MLGALAGRQPWGSTEKGVEGWGVSSHSLAMPPARKVVSSVGRVGSLPKSSAASKPDLFHFLVFGGALLHGFLWRALFGLWEASPLPALL